MDAVEKLLLKCEQGVHRDGWDQEPWLALLITPRPGVLAMARLPFVCDKGVLPYIARRLTEAPEIAYAIVHDYPGIQGLCLVGEGWAPPEDMPEEQLRQARAAGVRYADMPGGYEVRMVSAVMLTGQTLAVFRRRGHKPRLFSHGAELDGRVYEGLTAILLEIARQITDVPEYVPLLEDLAATFTVNTDTGTPSCTPPPSA